MKQLIGKIWLLWSAVIFITTFPIVFISYHFARITVPQKNIYNPFFNITKAWAKWLLFWIGVRTKVYGKQPFTQPCVFVCNHQSQFDIPVNFATSPLPFIILSKQEVTKIPVVRTNLIYSHVLVNRKNTHSRKQSMIDLDQHIKAGRNLLLYAEGSRKQKTILGEFKPGAFVLAIQNQVPIVPVTIIGTKNIHNAFSPFQIFPGKTEIHYHTPISTIGKTKDDVDEVLQNCRNVILECLTRQS